MREPSTFEVGSCRVTYALALEEEEYKGEIALGEYKAARASEKGRRWWVGLTLSTSRRWSSEKKKSVEKSYLQLIWKKNHCF